MENRYTNDGDMFYKLEGRGLNIIVQLKHHFSGLGASFKTVKWATWYNEHYICGLQETNESPELYGWTKMESIAPVLLLHSNTNDISKILTNIKTIKNLVELKYYGMHHTNNMEEIEYKLMGYR